VSATGETLAEKQRRLAAEIARQRGDIARAYHDLQTPIRYGEQALRGVGFLRQNAWIFTAVPATLSITTTIINLLRRKSGKPPTRGFKWGKREVEREAERESKTVASHFMKWGGRGWKLFRLYSRVRKFFP
jgi:hypothetical protein